MRRLLMVSYFFPPVGGVGVERTLKHATYLPEHGWQPVMVAPRNSAYRIVDPATIARIPAGTDVHRARSLEPGHLRDLAGRLVGRRRDAARRVPQPSGQSRQAGGLRRAANTAWAYLIPKIFYPDDQVLWIPDAVRVGLRAHRSVPLDAIYSSSPPVSGHIAAGTLARHLGLPWVADFRDPWIGNAFVAPPPRPHRALQRRLERWIVARADRVIFATAQWRQRYAERYPELQERFVHIPNGYDPAELGGDGVRHRSGEEPFRLIYAGSIYGERELDLLLDGLVLALDRDPSLRERLRVELVGWLSARNLATLETRRAAIEPVFRFLGFRPRPEVIAMERSADAGLILIADDPGREADVNAKLYEYLGLDLPVIAVAPQGETRAILEQLDWGMGADPTPAGFADGVQRLLETPRADRPADPERRFERRGLSAQLAALLDEVAG